MANLFSLQGRVALITGSAQGLGNTMARGLMEAGARIVLSDVSQAALDRAVEAFRAEGREVPAYRFDITDEPGVAAAVDAIEREVGPIDILINNAGIHKRDLLLDMPVENWRKVIDVSSINAIGPGYCLTDLTKPLAEDPAFDAWVKSEVPLRRWGDPEDLIGAAVMLASPASDYISGQTIYVDGGWQACL